MTNEPDVRTIDGLVQELENQASLLISVATGGPRIESVQADYAQRRYRLTKALKDRGLSYPFPWQDLWQWYGFWSATLVGYASRRAYIRDLVAPMLDALENQRDGLTVIDPGQSTKAIDWVDLDRRLAELGKEFVAAMSRDDLQDVGRRAREVLLGCGRLIADPDLVPFDEQPPKAGDAKAWLDLFLSAYASGPAREELRKLVRNAWDLAQKVTHGNLDQVDAFAAAQATVLVVRTVQQLALLRK